MQILNHNPPWSGPMAPSRPSMRRGARTCPGSWFGTWPRSWSDLLLFLFFFGIFLRRRIFRLWYGFRLGNFQNVAMGEKKKKLISPLFCSDSYVIIQWIKLFLFLKSFQKSMKTSPELQKISKIQWQQLTILIAHFSSAELFTVLG